LGRQILPPALTILQIPATMAAGTAFGAPSPLGEGGAMDILFGSEMPLAVRFVIAFVVVLALIGGTAFLVRRFGSNRMGGAGGRGRQPRLAVIDAAAVDGRRRLILIRRDNVEHLLMIGGPSDVVIEPNIVRGAAVPRETAAPRPVAVPEPLPRAVPLGEGNMWPLQPHSEPTIAPVPPPVAVTPPPPAPRLPRDEPAQWAADPEPPPMPPRQPRTPAADPLGGLAADLARGQADANPPRGAVRERPASPPSVDAGGEPMRGQPAGRTRIEPRMESPSPAANGSFTAAADQNLAEMAQRLEAALRRPGGARPKDPRATTVEAPSGPAIPSETEMQSESVSAAPVSPSSSTAEERSGRNAAAAKSPRGDSRVAGPPQPQKSVYDSLEQEMASLLGRPQGKT
jgi:hypothetical protein